MPLTQIAILSAVIIIATRNLSRCMVPPYQDTFLVYVWLAAMVWSVPFLALRVYLLYP